jgi:hypothetical protein
VVGHSKTYTIVQYRSGIIVSKTAVESQFNRKIEAMMQGLPASADRKIEYACAGVFNGSFATETTADGLFVFSASHTYEDEQLGTWDNLQTPSGFTTAAYFLAWQALQGRKNAKGFPDPMDLDEIVYPVALHEDVMQVLRSPKVAENALNAINAFAGDAKATKYNWLTSSTAWFAHGKRMGAAISDPMNPELIMGKRLRMAFECGSTSSREWEGNAGS